MGYALSQREINATIEVTGSSQFDAPLYPGDGQKICVSRVKFVGQDGKIVECDLTGPLYKADGTMGRSVRSASVAPPGVDAAIPDDFDVPWSQIPVRLQQEILRAVEMGA